MNYYNENDPQKAAWLRELIKTNVISKGIVDERSITEIEPGDLEEFVQCHFFSGIGIWSYALRLAQWPDDKRVWTGSCPCQPFSNAGKRKGEMDERHLWPAWFRLISECRPCVLFGEQIADGDGIAWLDNVQTDLEAENYRVGPCVLPAAGFGAPHGRHRLYFVADTEIFRSTQQSDPGNVCCENRSQSKYEQSNSGFKRCVPVRDMANPGQILGRSRPEHINGTSKTKRCEAAANSEHGSHACDLADSKMPKRGRSGNETNKGRGIEEVGGSSSVGVAQGDANETRPPGRPLRSEQKPDQFNPRTRSALNGFWSDAEWLWCRDGKYRAAKPGIFPLATGTPARILRLRGYGDGIVPQVASAFIKAYQGITQCTPRS